MDIIDPNLSASLNGDPHAMTFDVNGIPFCFDLFGFDKVVRIITDGDNGKSLL